MRILYIDIDSLRPDHLGCYGYNRPTSPNIDSIAAQGMRFNRFYCSDSPCMPSRTGLVTGRAGIHTGIVTHGEANSPMNIREMQYRGPEPYNQLLQLRLRETGLETWCFSNFASRHYATWFGHGWSAHFSPNLKYGGEYAEEVSASVLPWMKQHAAEDNWYCHINYWDVHRTFHDIDPKLEARVASEPVTVPWPDEETARAHGQRTELFTGGWMIGGHPSPSRLMPENVHSRADAELMLHGYDCMIAHVDEQIGRLMETLDEAGVLNETAIIISADHGDAFGEHAIYSDHACADECVHHIPMIVKWPGVAAPGSTCDSMLMNIDYFPTLCELLGAETPQWCDGQSFAGHLKGEPAFDRDHLVWGHGLYTLQRAVRTRDHLFIRTYDAYGFGQFDPLALYDMNADPYQTTNRIDTEPDRAAGMDQLLTQWINTSLEHPAAIPDPMQAVLLHRQQQNPRPRIRTKLDNQ